MIRIWAAAASGLIVMLAASAAVGQSGPGPAEVSGLMTQAYAAYDSGDFAAALPKFRAAAEAGNAEAQYMVGLMHHRGRGVPVNPAEAAKWYGRAGEQNLAPALCNLGIIYRDGLGQGDGAIAPDGKRAMELLRRAAYLENVPGQLAYAAMLMNRSASRDDTIEGVAFMRMAADAGDETAQDNLENLEIEDDVSAAADARRREIESSIAKIREMAAKGGTAVKPAPAGGDAAAEPGTVVRGDRASRGGGEAAPLRLQRVVVRDPMVRNCDALVMLSPVGWRFEGRIDWFVHESVLANPVWVMTEPESGASIRSLPFRQFTWSQGGVMPVGQNHMGMIVLPPIVDPAEFVQRFWVEGAGALPHLRGVAPASVQQAEALARLAVKEWGAPAEARGFRVRYVFGHEGREWEEEIRFALLYARGDPTIWLVTHCTAVRAPKGGLDRVIPIANAVCCSGTYTSEWRAAWRVCFDLLVKNARGVLQDSRALAAAVEANREHQQRLQREIEADRESSMAARNAAFRESLGGVETYSDPYQGRGVEMPQGYREAWVNERGEYLLSEQAGFDPNVGQVGGARDWKRMDKVDPMGGRR